MSTGRGGGANLMRTALFVIVGCAATLALAGCALENPAEAYLGSQGTSDSVRVSYEIRDKTGRLLEKGGTEEVGPRDWYVETQVPLGARIDLQVRNLSDRTAGCRIALGNDVVQNKVEPAVAHCVATRTE